MIWFEGQSELRTYHRFYQYDSTKLESPCKSGNAQDPKCLVSITLIIPTIIAIAILLVRVLQPLLRYRPRWTKPFISELKEKGQDFRVEEQIRYGFTTKALLVVIPTGLTVQLVTVLYPTYDATEIFPTTAWVI